MLNTIVNRNANTSAKKQLVEYLKAGIRDKKFRVGERLPTTKDFVRNAGVSSHTVRQAMYELIREGVLKAIPGRGTFLIDQEESRKAEFEDAVKVTNFVMLPASANPTLPDQFMVDSVRGFLSECHQRGIIGVIPPWTEDIQAGELCGRLKKISADGVIWVRPLPHNWPTLREIVKQGFSVVITSRSCISGNLPCVSGDYYEAGLRAARHFVSNDCKRVLFFELEPPTLDNHPDESVPINCDSPIGIKESLDRFYASVDNSSRRLESHFLRTYAPIESERIFETLQTLQKGDGVVFIYPQHLHNLLKEKRAAVIELLRGHPIVMVSNQAFLGHFGDSLKELDVTMVLDSFRIIMSHAVQKLAAIKDGYQDNAMTLVKVPFVKYSDWDRSTDSFR